MAAAGALAAALLVMSARLTRGRERFAAFEATAAEVEEAAERLRVELLELADRDSQAYQEFVAARRAARRDSGGGEPNAHGRDAQRMAAAAREAVGVPLLTARAAAAVGRLASRLADASNPKVISDVGCAALLAAAAMRGAAFNVRTNLPSLADDDALRLDATRELDALLSATDRDERSTTELVEARLK